MHNHWRLGEGRGSSLGLGDVRAISEREHIGVFLMLHGEAIHIHETLSSVREWSQLEMRHVVRHDVQEIIRLADFSRFVLEHGLLLHVIDFFQNMLIVHMDFAILAELGQYFVINGRCKQLLPWDVEELLITNSVAVPVVISQVQDLLRRAFHRCRRLSEDCISSLELPNVVCSLHCVSKVENRNNRVGWVKQSVLHAGHCVVVILDA